MTNNSAFVAQTRPIFNQYIQKQARTYYLVHQMLFSNPQVMQQKPKEYLKLSQNKTLPPLFLQEQFRSMADTLEAQGYNWYEANTAGGFWLRRSLEGNARQFFAVLQKLLLAYDPEFLFQKAR